MDNTYSLDPRERTGELRGGGGKVGPKPPEGIQEAAQRKFKGKYIGPDKYKGKIPAHLKSKYKGKYFGKEARKGMA